MEDSIRNISGRVGYILRQAYYSRRLRECGNNVRISAGVHIKNPQNISIGSDVFIGEYSLIEAGSNDHEKGLPRRRWKVLSNPQFQEKNGQVLVGSKVWIGAYNIIQGTGGITIEDLVTTSARVSIYSSSHLAKDELDPSRRTNTNAFAKEDNICCVLSPIVIGRNSWLGLNVAVFRGSIGPDSFIAANSLVIDNIPSNSISKGNPAKKVSDRFQDN